MAGGMKNVVEMGPQPPRYPNSAVNAIMNRRHIGMRHDAEENLKMIMQPNKAADYPLFNDPSMDPKNLRIFSSRLAALKSRVRKSEYIAQLEQQVDSLKAVVPVMAHQVSYYDCKRIELCNENEAMRKRIDDLCGEQKLKTAETKWLKQEKHRLSDILTMQHQLKQQLQLVPPELIHDQEQQEMVAECNLGEEQQLLDINSPMNLHPI
ncbi:hypothetical protein NE237_004642 [Protea cynaroides]|uniref:BZIP domain-containing protein n=1 Tax=Protea cynaroides TaxID=273540 RepID=A0A9Q0KJ17_9MAGN|nr:hypothetical protein NE237_004642 [Protea cynaroides]